MFKLRISVGIACILFLLSACNDQAKTMDTKSGSPEYAANQFFYSIYNRKNIDEMSKYATPKLQRIIKSYGSTNAVARHLLNMQFDEVIIEIDRGSNLRESYGDKATISLIFNGRLHGNKKADTAPSKWLNARVTGWLKK
jgi:hypothetical protein